MDLGEVDASFPENLRDPADRSGRFGEVPGSLPCIVSTHQSGLFAVAAATRAARDLKSGAAAHANSL